MDFTEACDFSEFKIGRSVYAGNNGKNPQNDLADI